MKWLKISSTENLVLLLSILRRETLPYFHRSRILNARTLVTVTSAERRWRGLMSGGRTCVEEKHVLKNWDSRRKQGMRGEEEKGGMKQKEELKPDKLIKERAAVWQMMHGAGSIDTTPPPCREGVWAGRRMERSVCIYVCVRVYACMCVCVCVCVQVPLL